MASRDRLSPSRRLQRAAVAERTRIERELTRLATRRERLTRELAAVAADEEELAGQLRVLNRLAADAANGDQWDDVPPAPPDPESPPPDEPRAVLKGVRIREMAVRLLLSSPAGGGPVHYRHWYEMVTSKGFGIAGRDSVASFLTQISRSPVVVRGERPGTYRIDLSFPARARHQLAELRAAHRTTHDSPDSGDVEQLRALREERAQLAARIGQLERALEEALRSIGDQHDGPNGRAPAGSGERGEVKQRGVRADGQSLAAVDEGAAS